MKYISILFILGRLLMLYSLSLIPVCIISLADDFGDLGALLITLALSFSIGYMAYKTTQKHPQRNQAGIKEGFLIVVLYWVVIGSVGSLPFLLSNSISQPLSLIDALFESFSGLTTTGATTLTNIEELSNALLYYRQQLQWLGGMGIIVLAIAIFPALGIGGAQMYRAEVAGPFKTNKISPRASETAKRLWYIYVGFTVLCAMAYWSAGMSLFDAILHSFSTLSIGGFSPYNDSIGHFNSIAIESIAIFFMIIGGMNYALHYSFLRYPSLTTLRSYIQELECQIYLLYLLAISLMCLFILWQHDTFDNAIELLRYGLFSAVSVATTTGFSNSDWSVWPLSLPILLIFASFIGGCSGSTAGGIKLIRFIMIFKQGAREVWMLIHPNAVRSVMVNQRKISPKVTNTIWGFFSIYLFSFIFLMVLLLLAGNDAETAFTALAACINNLGPATGELHQHYNSLNSFSKLVLTFAMLVGRLEFYTLLVILTPAYWRI